MENKKLSLYLFFVFSLAVLCFYKAFSLEGTFSILNDIYGIIFFIILSGIAESLLVRFNHIAISSGFAITLASILLFGTFKAMLIVSIGVALRFIKYDGKYIHIFNTPIYKTLFNISNLAISIFVSSSIANLIVHNGDIIIINNIKILYFLVLVVVFFIVNTLIISLLIKFLSNQNFIYVFLNNMKFGILNIFAMAPFGFLLAYLYRAYNIFGIVILLVPIMLSRYTFMLYIESKSKYIETVEALMHAIEARDKYTEGHSRRVADISIMIARELKYSEHKIEKLKIASLLHDVGKIGIDDSILNKPGKLSIEEFNLIKQHPVIGYEILKNIKDFEDINLIVKHHHERYDGKGYPSGKSADELGLDIFIVQLADSIDAMETDRPYRKALSREKVINEVKKNSGTQFHPVVVNAYLSAVEKYDWK